MADPLRSGPAVLDCFLCRRPMRPDALPLTFHCSSCGLFRSAFPVEINRDGEERLDEARREQALRPLRIANFGRLLDALAPHLSPGAALLDVGCAHGWFVQAAGDRGYRAIGLEPDRQIARRARASGAAVSEGYFPEDLPPGETFDAISFNDVFEHMPEPHRMAKAVHDRLRSGGVVVLNLPMAEGAVFQVARLAARLGVRGPLARMWQEGLPSPHLAYYTAGALVRLMARHGFQLVAQGSLPSMKIEGLWARIRYDRTVSVGRAAALYVAAIGLSAASAILPADIGYVVMRKD